MAQCFTEAFRQLSSLQNLFSIPCGAGAFDAGPLSDLWCCTIIPFLPSKHQRFLYCKWVGKSTNCLSGITVIPVISISVFQPFEIFAKHVSQDTGVFALAASALRGDDRQVSHGEWCLSEGFMYSHRCNMLSDKSSSFCPVITAVIMLMPTWL